MSDVQITDWQQRVAVLAQAERLRQFEIADLLVLGIEQFGATVTYDFAETVFPQYARSTFQCWVTVAKHFPKDVRIESDWLTFGHYQVAQGKNVHGWTAAFDKSESECIVATEMVWLRQADERRLSVSAFRETIAHAFELRQEQFFNEHPESKPVELEPEPIIASKRKDAFGAELKELKTPWLKKQTRWSLDELARARRVTTEQLLQRVIQDFLDAHSDEIGNAELAAKKRESEHDAQIAAADAERDARIKASIEQAREQREQRARVEQAESERQAAIERERDELCKQQNEQRRREVFLAEALVSEVQIAEVLS